MNKISEYLLIPIVAGLVGLLFTYVMWDNSRRTNDQAAIIEQLRGDVKAMTSAFKEISLELLKSQYAYSSWSVEIDKFRKAMDDVPEIPPIGRWENKKEATKGEME